MKYNLKNKICVSNLSIQQTSVFLVEDHISAVQIVRNVEDVQNSHDIVSVLQQRFSLRGIHLCYTKGNGGFTGKQISVAIKVVIAQSSRYLPGITNSRQDTLKHKGLRTR